MKSIHRSVNPPHPVCLIQPILRPQDFNYQLYNEFPPFGANPEEYMDKILSCVALPDWWVYNIVKAKIPDAGKKSETRPLTFPTAYDVTTVLTTFTRLGVSNRNWPCADWQLDLIMANKRSAENEHPSTPNPKRPKPQSNSLTTPTKPKSKLQAIHGSDKAGSKPAISKTSSVGDDKINLLKQKAVSTNTHGVLRGDLLFRLRVYAVVFVANMRNHIAPPD